MSWNVAVHGDFFICIGYLQPRLFPPEASVSAFKIEDIVLQLSADTSPVLQECGSQDWMLTCSFFSYPGSWTSKDLLLGIRGGLRCGVSPMLGHLRRWMPLPRGTPSSTCFRNSCWTGSVDLFWIGCRLQVLHPKTHNLQADRKWQYMFVTCKLIIRNCFGLHFHSGIQIETDKCSSPTWILCRARITWCV